jgi:hypothetical protein
LNLRAQRRPHRRIRRWKESAYHLPFRRQDSPSLFSDSLSKPKLFLVRLLFVGSRNLSE